MEHTEDSKKKSTDPKAGSEKAKGSDESPVSAKDAKKVECEKKDSEQDKKS